MANTGIISAPVVVNPYSPAARGLHGNKLTGTNIPVVITTSSTRTAAVSYRDLFTTPLTTAIAVVDATGFTVGSQVEIYENDLSNREIVAIVAISGNTITVKPNLKKTHPQGAIVAIPGSKGVVYDRTSPGIVAARLPIIIRADISAITLPFQPKIVARVVIAANATGLNVVYTKTAVIVAPVIIKASATAQLRTAGYVAGKVEFGIDASGSFSTQRGEIAVTVLIGSAISGRGYTVTGIIGAPIKINSNIRGTQKVNGIIKSPIRVGINARGTASAVSSLYGMVPIRIRALAYRGPSAGTIDAVLPISSTAIGATADPFTSKYGPITATVVVRATSRGRVPNIASTFNKPMVVPIIPGRFRNDAQGRETAVFSAIQGRSYLSPGVLTPDAFRYGAIAGTGPVARFTATIGGAVGSLFIQVNGVSIVQAVTATDNESLATAFADAVNSSTDAPIFSAKAIGATVTFYAPSNSGGLYNGAVITHNSSGNRTLNGVLKGTVVGYMTGGFGGNVIVTPAITAAQFTGINVGIATSTVNFGISALGSVRSYSGAVSAPVVISCKALDGLYGIAISKLNVGTIIDPPAESITVAKVSTNAMLVHAPSAAHVAKVVAYAVIGPNEGDVSYESYEAVLFF